MRTGHWVRAAMKEGPFVVTDRGQRVALLANEAFFADFSKPFPRRDRSRLPVTSLDSTRLISQERES